MLDILALTVHFSCIVIISVVLQALPIHPSNWYLLSDDVNSVGVKLEMNVTGLWFVYSVKSIVLFHCFTR